MLMAVGDSDKVIAGQLAHLAGEAAGTVGHNDLGFAVTAWVEQNVTNQGVTGVIFEADRL